MDVAALLVELYGRIPPLADRAVTGLSSDDLCRLPVEGTNSIGWLIWHLTRVQDHHTAEAFGIDQLWMTGGWPQRFGLSPDPDNIGYGHTPADVARVHPEDVAALTDYLGAVHARTLDLIVDLGPSDLDRIVDERWDPPVSLGVRLISVADDGIQHVGQANYLRGFFDQGLSTSR